MLHHVVVQTFSEAALGSLWFSQIRNGFLRKWNFYNRPAETFDHCLDSEKRDFGRKAYEYQRR
jgi:hypothetical protein